jgi:leucyl-tRNA synthetase
VSWKNTRYKASIFLLHSACHFDTIDSTFLYIAMRLYNHKENDIKWQKNWDDNKVYRTEDISTKKKVYVLDMFPYPSGEGLHVGHPKGYIATDIYSRFKRMNGYNVLHPMGWDAFGLPAEQFALKNKIHPRIAVEKNIANFKSQLSKIGLDYDWTREINTTDPGFYKWTQWIFTKLYEKGLAYESYEPINWCPTCKTGLANEDLNGDLCERCDTEVEKKPLRQWVLKITAYADRMLKDLDALQWPEGVKLAQKNWIGRSEGAEFEFALTGIDGVDDGYHKVKIFTTRADTMFGATFLAIAPSRAEELIRTGWRASEEVVTFIETIKEELERKENRGDTVKRGIFTGLYAINPVTNSKIPVWIANYVLGDIGTGAIMAVPSHDERDFEFAQMYSLPKVNVIMPEAYSNDEERESYLMGEKLYTGEGIVRNSKGYDNLSSQEAREKIIQDFNGAQVVRYKIEDWVFARQRYWGEPFPIVRDKNGKVYTVDQTDLPVLLPDVESYEPTGTGESPLAAIKDWVEVRGYITERGTFKKSDEGEIFFRETNTMPQWAGSSWYYLRFADPHNENELISKDREKMMLPVDVYVGGDHATRHLIYARFWHKFLYDIGVVSTIEPFSRLEFLGFILAEDGRKMSKRWGNVINPDDVVAEYGADTLRVYEMFMAPFEQTASWSTTSIKGADKFLDRVYALKDGIGESSTVSFELHKTIKKVGEDIEAFKFNTAVSQMMILVNAMEKGGFTKDDYMTLLKVLSPFAPHLTEEVWHSLGGSSSIHLEAWPIYDATKMVVDSVTISLQINGKMRGTFTASNNTTQEELLTLAKELESYKKYIGEEVPKKVIMVPNRLLNIVI